MINELPKPDLGKNYALQMPPASYTTRNDMEHMEKMNELDMIRDYQITHGSLLKLVRDDEYDGATARTVGVSALPTPLPRSAFDRAISLQSHFNELYVRAACDESWLYRVLEPLLPLDPLVASLWKIHSKVKDAGHVQSIACGIFRSDYMLHKDSSIKQVEMNTVSIAGACHAERVANMHRYLRKVQNLDAVGHLCPRLPPLSF